MVKKVQGYTLLECVGKGSSGEVFRASHCYKEGQFAIKVIENQLLIDNPKAQQCLINEVKILSKIGVCENISKNNHYFVYDYCNGGNLYDKIKKSKRIPQSQALQYIQDILNAFKILNKFKVLHRDLKPQNILFHNDKLKLADFGLCKGLKPEQFMTKTMLGSPIYMAPQVLKGQSYTSKADIWSLGVIIFQMLYGYCPYHSNSIASLASKIDKTYLQLPEKPLVSISTQQILKKMLNKDHFRRIGWIQLFKEFLNQGEIYQVKSMQIKQINSSLSKSKKKQNKKKTSLCLIQQLSPSIITARRDSKPGRSQALTPEKQNKMNFNYTKYMKILNKNEQRIRKPSNFQPNLLNNQSLPLSCNSPTHKDSQKLYSTNIQYANKNVKSNCNIKRQPQKIQFAVKTKKNYKQFIQKLQKLHQEFVKIYPLCQVLLKTKCRQNLTQILQFLLILRLKLIKFSKKFTQIKSQMNQQHEDQQTMIKYQIIGIQNTIQQIILCLNDKNLKNIVLTSYNSPNILSRNYKFKNYAIQNSTSRIVDIQL